MANDATKVSAITAGVGLDSLLNPTSLRLHQVAKQPKYNGNPRRWPQFQREFKLWVKTQKLQDDQFLMALLDCLEFFGSGLGVIARIQVPPLPLMRCGNSWRYVDPGCQRTTTTKC